MRIVYPKTTLRLMVVFSGLLIANLFPDAANAGIFNKKLKLYNCKSLRTAQSCDDTCQISTDHQVEYKINEKNSVVMESYYEGNRLVGSLTYKNCSIVDKNNWSCDSDSIVGSGVITMTKGRIVSAFSWNPTRSEPKVQEVYQCTK